MEDVIVFEQYQFVVGDKIHIRDGRRKGDWLVAALDDKKMTLRCPVSGREFSWSRFCYHVEKTKQSWPMD